MILRTVGAVVTAVVVAPLLLLTAATVGVGSCESTGQTAVAGDDLQRATAVAKVAAEAGWSGEQLVVAVAVAGAESGWAADRNNARPDGSPLNRDGTFDHGLWQINSRWLDGTYGRLVDDAAAGAYPAPAGASIYRPAVNAAAAWHIWRQSGWGAWSAWNAGAHLDHLDVARRAVAAADAGGVNPTLVSTNCIPSAATVTVDGMACPVPGSQFIDDWHFPRSGGRLHKGLDMFADHGAPAYAVEAGTISTGTGGLGGVVVRVHGDSGVRWYYAHMSGYAPGIRDGVRVEAGQLIAYVGNTGNAASTPPHVHLGRYIDGVATPLFTAMQRLCVEGGGVA